MSDDLSLDKVLEVVESGNVTVRKDGLKQLKAILQHHKGSLGERLDQKALAEIFESLFRLVDAEKSAWLAATKPSPRSLAKGRLEAAAGVLRLAVETSSHAIKLRLGEVLIDHVIETLSLSDGTLCDPLAIDYAKCLRAIFSHQALLENLPRKKWERVLRLCIKFINVGAEDAEDDHAASNVEMRSINGTLASSISYRSSRSDISQTGQDRTLLKQISDELLGILCLLVALPNAPLSSGTNSSALLEALITYLRHGGRAQKNAFIAINHALLRTRTENITLTQSATRQIVRLIRHFWSIKSLELKDEMLKALLYLHPFLVSLMQRDERSTVRPELTGLLHVVRAECNSDSNFSTSLRLMRLDDLRLGIQATTDGLTSCLKTSIFQLRCVTVFSENVGVQARAERSWVAIEILAALTKLLMKNSTDTASSDDDTDGDDRLAGLRPRKRQRLADEFVDLLRAITARKASERLCALQNLTFLAQLQSLSARQLNQCIDTLTVSCTEDNSNVASWAFLALASCASQVNATNTNCASGWHTAWQIASHAITNDSTCRAACHFLSIATQLCLVPQTAVSELTQILIGSPDLTLADSVLQLLRLSLQRAQQSNPQIAASLSVGVLRWLTRTFVPSRFVDRAFAATHHWFDLRDMTRLLDVCANHPEHSMASEPVPLWEAVAQAWVTCEEQRDLVSYLLLLPAESGESGVSHHMLQPAINTPSAATSAPRLACETMILNHFLSELQKMQVAWERPEAQSAGANKDLFSSLSLSLCIISCIAYCRPFKDDRKRLQMQNQLEHLLSTIRTFLAGPHCTSEKIDIMLLTCSQMCGGLQPSGSSIPHTATPCEEAICQHIIKALSARQRAIDLNEHDTEQDFMEIDNDDSQDSRREYPTAQSDTGLESHSRARFSLTALRQRMDVYALIIVLISTTRKANDGERTTASARLVDHVLALSAEGLILSCSVLSRLDCLGLTLESADAYRLLDCCADHILASWTYRRSEVAHVAVIGLVKSNARLCTNREEKELFVLAEDTYIFFMSHLTKHVLSPAAQLHLAGALLEICQVDTDYGRDTEVGSVRTCLFTLLQVSSVPVLYHLAGRISVLFNLFVLSAHQPMFDDLQASLPIVEEWTEGLALRLLFLSKLASAWHSLRRQCIWYIFESAGKAKQSLQYAASCIAELAKALHFDSSQKLFHLFAPQLFYSWMEDHTLNSLPYAAFQFASLGDLLNQNQEEIVAQLIVRGKDDSFHVLTAELKASPDDLAKQSFAKCLAYSISVDIVKSSTDPSNAASETRLRGLVGGKDRLRELATQQGAAVLGHFYLATQQDDVHDRWLDKKSEYASAAERLSEIKRYSHSPRPLPSGQQPCFKTKWLPEQIARLCRRTLADPADLWTPSSFALAARMLLDAIHDALGPLHTCLILRKLRVLVCMAGHVALKGYALEMLVHSVRPFLSDGECADDALGMLQYLLNGGQAHFKAEGLTFVNGVACLMILQMREHAGARQDSTTQESQHKMTVQKMDNFQAWLVSYLQQCNVHGTRSHHALVMALKNVRLPGNARKDSPESNLLLILLEQLESVAPMIHPSHCEEALRLLTRNFNASMSPSDDCLGNDDLSASYAQALWRVLSKSGLDRSFSTWAAMVLGRGYAATGRRPNYAKSATALLDQLSVKPEGSTTSEANIVKRLVDLMLSNRRIEAGLADWTVRKIESSFYDAEQALDFEHLLPATIIVAVAEGPCGYRPSETMTLSTSPVTRQRLHEVLEVSLQLSDEEWTSNVTVAFCQWAPNVPVLAALPTILGNIPGLAAEFFPWIVHILLGEEIDKDPVVQAELSATMSKHLALREKALCSRARLLIQTLMYLRSQPRPGEETKIDRLHWLQVDPLQAAEAAVMCRMPTSALMLVESIPPDIKSNRRASSRVSLSQLARPQVPDELLLSIFKQVEEPDSYYGVQQPASLDAILQRLDYEGAGFKSLLFRSARLDSAMRSAHSSSLADAAGLMNSLSALNLNSLEYALLSGPMGNAADSSGDMLESARKLQQWDILPPSDSLSGSAITFSAFQELSRASDRQVAAQRLRSLLLVHLNTDADGPGTTSSLPSIEWCNTLSILTETCEVLGSSTETAFRSRWEIMQSRSGWMLGARFQDAEFIVSSRSTLFSVLAQNNSLTRDMHVNARTARSLEAESLLNVAQFARQHGVMQEALSTVTQLDRLSKEASELGLKVEAAASFETAFVLWESGEASASVKMLQDILKLHTDLESQDIPVGRSGLLAQLGHQLAEARLDKPEEILDGCLKPAIAHLKARNRGNEAGNVFHEFASFCDQQLQNPGNLEDFKRIETLRQRRLSEMQELEALSRSTKKTAQEREAARLAARKAKPWFEIDDGEYQRFKASRDSFMVESLQNYLLALQASDEHDIDVLRFFALWLENADSSVANAVTSKHLPTVPSWKFVLLNNQLMSRLENDKSTFQSSLKALLLRICAEHPYQSLHQLFATTRSPPSHDQAARSRYDAARGIRETLQADPRASDIQTRWFRANNAYDQMSQQPLELPSGSKVKVKDFPPATKMVHSVIKVKVPPATVDIKLRPDGKYADVPIVTRFDESFTLMGGISKPKAMSAYATDGQKYKQLFKNDDLRQDAIMEQVFEQVSEILKKHKTTRQRQLHVRTYKVIPLTPKSGIIEFVPNSIPIGDWLKPAHLRYYPRSMRNTEAFQKIRGVEKQSTESRIKEFQKVCDQQPPVLRHFFFEHFDDPDEWFQRRTAYTRTTAAVSILGHVLGLGDRHCQNILLDEKTGEAVHIDLGVAFEAGRVLPIPETVPFRLSRDIADAMGVTKWEGIFRRCCEFTMDALRDDKDNIMTLLNVLRYDPLVSWTLSPLRAKRMQDAQETGRNGGADGEEVSSKRKEQEAGEADRALSIVEKKLSKTLSTAATVNELIQTATDERNLALLFAGWSAFY